MASFFNFSEFSAKKRDYLYMKLGKIFKNFGKAIDGGYLWLIFEK